MIAGLRIQKLMATVFLTVLFLTSLPSLAQQPAGVPRFTPRGIAGSAGFGIAVYNIHSPANSFRVDQGIFVALSGEKGFDFAHLYLVLSLNYVRNGGQTNYNYTTLSGTSYSVNDISFEANVFQAGLGLRFKLIDNYWFRPYIEGGGLGGFHELRYTNRTTELRAQGADYKARDSILDFGHYGEAGIEIQFSEKFGIRTAARVTQNRTKEVETLDRQKLSYTAQAFYFALLSNF